MNLFLGYLFYSFLKFFIYFNLFYFWLCWVFIAVHGLSLVAVSGGYSLLQCAGFSLWWLLLLQSMGSRCTGLSSCGMQAWLLRGMWDLPGPGLEPVSPALAGGFLTTASPGKPYFWAFYSVLLINVSVFRPVPCCFGYYSFCSMFWNQVMWWLQFCFVFACVCSRLLELFTVFLALYEL